MRVGPVSPLPALLRELGHDPAPVLAACGLPPGALDDPERRLPYRQVAAVVEQAAHASRREDFGLLLGQRFELDHFGLLGRLLWRAATVGEALHDLYRYFPLQDRGGVAYLQRRDAGTVALGYVIVDADTPGTALVQDLVLAIAMRLMRGLAGGGFRVIEVHLARARPADPRPYRRMLGAPLHFDAAQSELRFDAAWLRAPVAGADAGEHQMARQAAEAAEADMALGVAGRARAVAQMLLAGGEVSVPGLADALGLHERTLRRRLAGEGTSVRDVIAAARFELAKHLLRDTRLPVGRIATALGYGDASAFLRAFRGWSGLTPGRWRAARRAGAGSSGIASPAADPPDPSSGP